MDIIEYFHSLPKEEQAKYIINANFIEEYEVKRKNAIHLPKANGHDGVSKDGKIDYEVKCQIETGLENSIPLKGLFMFGTASKLIYERNLKSNTHIIVVGYSNKLIYRFSFNFKAIQERYKKRYIDNEEKGIQSKLSLNLFNVFKHKSFKLEYVADLHTLRDNRHRIQNKLFKYISDKQFEKEIKGIGYNA